MKNLRSHLLMRWKKNILPASKALITSYSLNIKGPFLSSFYPLRCSDMLCQSTYYAPVPSFFSFFFIVDSRSGGTFDMEALRILMPFYFP